MFYSEIIFIPLLILTSTEPVSEDFLCLSRIDGRGRKKFIPTIGKKITQIFLTPDIGKKNYTLLFFTYMESYYFEIKLNEC